MPYPYCIGKPKRLVMGHKFEGKPQGLTPLIAFVFLLISAFFAVDNFQRFRLEMACG